MLSGLYMSQLSGTIIGHRTTVLSTITDEFQ